MRKTFKVKVGNIYIGGDSPIVIQSMTDTVTSDVYETTRQIIDLYNAGSEIVRITVDNREAARSIPLIKKKLEDQGYFIPLVGDFHYNGHLLLDEFPSCAKSLDKYRINPGNVGFGLKKDLNYKKIIEKAIEYDKPIRIGVNWGSLDQVLLQKLMDENSKNINPLSSRRIMQKAMINSALESASYAISLGLSQEKIIISCKVSNFLDLTNIYKELSKSCNYPLHLGLTEAGMGVKGIVSSSISLGYLLSMNIGDTIRVSLTPRPKDSRCEEVKICQEILQTLELRSFFPSVSSCPGCGRTKSKFFRNLAGDIQKFLVNNMKNWKNEYEGVEKIKIAVMGCIVNGPGESKHADIGISLPGIGEIKRALVCVDGKKFVTLKGSNITEEFIQIVKNYISENCSKKK